MRDQRKHVPRSRVTVTRVGSGSSKKGCDWESCVRTTTCILKGRIFLPLFRINRHVSVVVGNFLLFYGVFFVKLERVLSPLSSACLLFYFRLTFVWCWIGSIQDDHQVYCAFLQFIVICNSNRTSTLD